MRETNEAVDITERARVLEKIADRIDLLIDRALELPLILPSLNKTSAVDHLHEHMNILINTLDLEAIRPPNWLRTVLGVTGGTALSVMALNSAEILNWLQAKQQILAILGISVFGLGKLTTEKVLGMIYPKIPGLCGITGIHDGALYRRAMKMIDTLHVKQVNAK